MFEQSSRRVAAFSLFVFGWAAVFGQSPIPGWTPEDPWPPLPPGLEFSPPADAAEARRQDVALFRPFLYLNRSFSYSARTDAEQLLQALEAEIDAITDLEFLVRLHRIVAVADNAHTSIREGLFARRFGALPLRGSWFDDGFYVLRATPNHAELLGGRVDEIEGRPVEDVLELLEPLVGGPKVYMRTVASDLMLLTPALLHHLGLAASPDSLRVRVTDSRRQTRERTIDVLFPTDQAPFEKSWVNLLPSAAREGDSWLSLLTDENGPEFVRDWSKPFSFSWIGPGRIPYLQIRANRDSGGSVMSEFLTEVGAALEAGPFRAIVVDLRLDYGGDFTSTSDLFLGLSDKLTENGKLYILVSNVTFSAGLLGAAYLKHGAGDRAVVVGQTVGDRTRFWSEAPSYELPNSGARLKYALQMHDVGAGCDNPAICFAIDSAEEVAVGSLEPDIPVAFRFEDYAAGRDLALELVLRRIRAGGDDTAEE